MDTPVVSLSSAHPGKLYDGSNAPRPMEPESFSHVALKTDHVDDAAAFYREHPGAELLERGHPDGKEGAEAVEHAILEVGDKRLYLFDRAPYEAAGLVDPLPTGFLHFGYVVADVERASRDLAPRARSSSWSRPSSAT